jgi:hypothetical protein
MQRRGLPREGRMGQRGFRLSLLGFEPEEDYEHIVKEGKGRRVFPVAPEQSLLLLKAANIVPYGAGRKSTQSRRATGHWFAGSARGWSTERYGPKAGVD